MEPDISNPDDLFKILTVAEKAGGLTPNKARSVVGEALGEKVENYEGDWGEIPIAAKDLVNPQPAQTGGPSATPGLIDQLSGQIQKAAANRDDEVVAVMKQVRALLVQMQEGEGHEV